MATTAPRIGPEAARPSRQPAGAGPAGADLLQLLRSAQRDEQDALDRLLAALDRSVRHFFDAWIFRSAESDELAADLTQETLLLVARGFRSCRATTELELRAWCRVVAQHVATDHLRAQREWPTSSALRAASGEAAAAPDDAARDVGYGILLRVLEDAHAGESDDVHSLLWHHLVAQDTWEETAKALGTSPSAAKRRFQRVQRRLRKKVLDGIGRLGEVERSLVVARMDALCGFSGRRGGQSSP